MIKDYFLPKQVEIKDLDLYYEIEIKAVSNEKQSFFLKVPLINVDNQAKILRESLEKNNLRLNQLKISFDDMKVIETLYNGWEVIDERRKGGGCPDYKLINKDTKEIIYIETKNNKEPFTKCQKDKFFINNDHKDVIFVFRFYSEILKFYENHFILSVESKRLKGVLVEDFIK